MTISTTITTALSSLQAQVAAAAPLANASIPTITALQLNAAQLVSDIQTALTATSTLDTWVAPADPISMVNGFDQVVVAGVEIRSNLSLMRGVVGRAASNLDQL